MVQRIRYITHARFGGVIPNKCFDCLATGLPTMGMPAYAVGDNRQYATMLNKFTIVSI